MQVLVKFLACGLGNGNGHAHAMSRNHALHKTVESYGTIESQSRGETRTHPERIDRFDKHSVSADVARASTQDCGTPFDFEVCAKRVARRPAAFVATGWMIPTAHRTGATPCQGLRPRRSGEIAASLL